MQVNLTTNATLTVHVVAQARDYVAADSGKPGGALHVLGHGRHKHSGRGGCRDGGGCVGAGNQRTYTTGGRAGNRVAVDKPLRLQSC